MWGRQRGRGEPWGEERGRPGGPHWRGGRHRMFEGNELRLLLLHLIAQEPRHGYDLVRTIEALSRGTYMPSPGAIYPTLTLLVELGLLGQPDTDRQRKRFSITEQGRTFLAQNEHVVKQVLERLGEAGEAGERTDAAPIRRAMHNLKSALFEKLAVATDKKTVLDIAALIDEAAQKIERLGT